MKKKSLIIILISIILILIGGGVFIFRDYIFASPAERTVIRFLKAIESQKFDAALKYVWPPERNKISTSSKILESVSDTSDSKAQIKFSKLRYETIKISEKNAEVNVKGKLGYQFFGAFKEMSFDQNFELIKEEGTWYIKSLF
jgi:hypothetical protein